MRYSNFDAYITWNMDYVHLFILEIRPTNSDQISLYFFFYQMKTIGLELVNLYDFFFC